jgi:DUF971 family protein
MNTTSAPVPIEIGRANEHDVKVIWQDGHESVYPARALRLACPCAGCLDEVTGAIRLIATSLPEDVHPLKVDLVGRYAITIAWSDGHHTGIYPFELLRRMCPCCHILNRGYD